MHIDFPLARFPYSNIQNEAKPHITTVHSPVTLVIVNLSCQKLDKMTQLSLHSHRVICMSSYVELVIRL